MKTKPKTNLLGRRSQGFLSTFLTRTFIATGFLATMVSPTQAQDSNSWGDFQTEGKVFDAELYGYLEGFVEKVEDTPIINPDGSFSEEENPLVFTTKFSMQLQHLLVLSLLNCSTQIISS